MCTAAALVPIAMTTTAIAGGVQAYGQYQAGQSQAAIYNYQGALAQQQAATTRAYAEQREKGIKSAAAANITAIQDAAAHESKIHGIKVAELTGAQKAAIGALGIGGSVTAADIITSSYDKATLDRLAIRHNANLKSWQIREQSKLDIWSLREETKQRAFSLESDADQFSLAAKRSRRAGGISAAGTLIGTAAKTAAIGIKL